MDLSKVAPDRIEVLKRIPEYEKEGKFDQTLENDPVGKELLPEDVD